MIQAPRVSSATADALTYVTELRTHAATVSVGVQDFKAPSEPYARAGVELLERLPKLLVVLLLIPVQVHRTDAGSSGLGVEGVATNPCDLT